MALRSLLEGEPGHRVNGTFARIGFPAADNDIAIVGVDLDGSSAPTGLLGGYDRGARAGKGVKDEIAAPRAILDGVRPPQERSA